MAMTPFYTKFRDLAIAETRTVLIPAGTPLPAGEYGFMEFYCDDPGCDCRRVVLQALRPDSGDKVWASINYGWEQPSYYRKWMSSNARLARGMAGATLDPLNPQTEYSAELLDLFQQVVLKDPAYIRRLRRHYEMFKKA